MYQLAQLVIHLSLLACVACLQFTVFERWLRGLGTRQWAVRLGLSLLQAAFGYGTSVGVLALANVIASGDYRRGCLSSFGMLLVTVGGAVLGAALPWISLLRGNRSPEPAARANRKP